MQQQHKPKCHAAPKSALTAERPAWRQSSASQPPLNAGRQPQRRRSVVQLSSRWHCPTRQVSLGGGRSRRRGVACKRNPASHNAGQAHPAGHIVPEVAGRGLAVGARAARALVLRPRAQNHLSVVLLAHIPAVPNCRLQQGLAVGNLQGAIHDPWECEGLSCHTHIRRPCRLVLVHILQQMLRR